MDGSFSPIQKISMSSSQVPQVKTRLNLKEARWDQSTYLGRAKHFFAVTNPFNLLKTSHQLDAAESIVKRYGAGAELKLSEDEVWRAKYLYDSAHHPETGKRTPAYGRMSSQVPMNILLIGGMISTTGSTPLTIFFQWANQTYNAIVNYTNRSGGTEISQSQLVVAYSGATGGALAVALGLGRLARRMPPIAAKCVPFAACAAGNVINIPIMRGAELKAGIPVFDKNEQFLGDSKVAAKSATVQVTGSRIIMAVPSMLFPPILLQALWKKNRIPKTGLIPNAITIIACGICLAIATPLACALFPQKSSISVGSLEESITLNLVQEQKNDGKVYFNKGL